VVDEVRHHDVLARDVAHPTHLGVHVRQPRQRRRVEPPTDAVAVFEEGDPRFRVCLLQPPRAIGTGDASTDYGNVQIHHRLPG
jgi:hypothetical protein